ncbi:MAG: ABC transporter substrate-binding protein [Candidatus Hodarchaeales archaeon]|jgi:peptide/nickel transport system substrate-binding protein
MNNNIQRFSLTIIIICIFGLFTPLMISAQQEEVPNKDIFVYKTIGIIDTLDPATSREPLTKGINEQICERLVNFEGDSTNLIGELATNWTISPDGLNYTFSLRQGVTFTDGTPFNAWVMKYSIDRTHIINDPNGLVNLSAEYIKGGFVYISYENSNTSEANAYLAEEGIKVIDDYTLKIFLNKPFSPILSILQLQSMCAVSPKAVIDNIPINYIKAPQDDDFGMVDLNQWFPELNGNYTKLGLSSDWFSQKSGVVPGSLIGSKNEFLGFKYKNIGTGPYKLADDDETTWITLNKNNNWWNDEQFHSDAVNQIIIKVGDGINERVQDFEDGTADQISLKNIYHTLFLKNDNYVISKPLEVYDTTKYQVSPINRFENEVYIFNMNDTLPATTLMEAENSNFSKGKMTYQNLNKYSYGIEKAKPGNPFTSMLFRKAWARSMNYEEMINEVYGGLGIRMEGVIPQGMLGHDDQLIEDGRINDFSPIAAKAVFEEVGWAGTVYIAYNGLNMFRKTISQLLKNTIEAYDVGISIIVQEFTNPTFLDQRNSGNLAMFLHGWKADYYDPHTFLEGYFSNRSVPYLDKYYIINPIVNSLMEQALDEIDQHLRDQLYRWVEWNISLDNYFINLGQKQDVILTRTWITDIEDSGSLNPSRNSLNFAKIGKKDYWNPPANPSDINDTLNGDFDYPLDNRDFSFRITYVHPLFIVIALISISIVLIKFFLGKRLE